MEREQALREEILQIVRDYPDFPTKGILFRDLLPLFAKPALLRSLCIFIANRYKGKVDVVAGLEARGFLFGPIVALELNLPFVPIRKKGKLPGPVSTAEYQKEYGKDVLEMQQGILLAGQHVLLIDDLLATGGSLKAAEQLVKSAQAEVAAIYVPIELSKLGGRKVLETPVIDALISYSD